MCFGPRKKDQKGQKSPADRVVDPHAITAYERKNLDSRRQNRSHLSAIQSSESYTPTYTPTKAKAQVDQLRLS
jgi:hypothetical protein